MSALGTVVVIGQGAAGLVTLKNLLEEGFDATGFEQNSYVGGLWQYTEELKTSVLASTISNVTKERGCFTDFPFPEEAGTNPTAAEIQDYLVEYARNFHLYSHIRFGTTILEIERDKASEKWVVSVRDKEGSEIRLFFDKVVVASGTHAKPIVPTIEGEEAFQGKIIHSRDFKSPREYKDQRVLVVGIANTAADTATALVDIASKVYLSHKRGAIVVKRINPDGVALDHAINYRKTVIQYAMTRYAPLLAQRLGDAYLRSVQNKSFNIPEDWPLAAAPSLMHGIPIVSETLVPAMHEDKITSVRVPKKALGGSLIELDDGRRVEIDTIVWCTGYQADYRIVGKLNPYLSQAGRQAPESRYPQNSRASNLGLPHLYRNIFSLDYPESLAFVGSCFFHTPAFLLYDLGSMAISQVWKDPSRIPTQQEMLHGVERHTQWAEDIASRGTFNPRFLNAWEWMEWVEQVIGSQVDSKLGYGLSGWMFWAQDRAFCSLLMGGILSPHIYRLFESNGKRKTWQGAREAIERANAHAGAHAELKKVQ